MTPLIKFANLFMAIFISFSLLSSVSPGIFKLARASDKTRVEKACSQTQEPEICKLCLFSDHSRETDSTPELIHSIIFCMYTEATHGHENADMMSQKSIGKLQQALTTCSAKLFNAENLLADGLMLMEGKNYNNAYNNLRQSRMDMLSCEDAFRKVANAPVPDTLQQNLTPLNRLFDVAYDFFRTMNIGG